MSHHSSAPVTIQPTSLKISQSLKTAAGIFAVIGVVTFAAGLYLQPQRAWPNFLLNYFFFLVLSLFGVFFTALQHVTNAYWSVTVRRFSEALMSYLPVALVLGFVIILGRHHLYEWTHTEAVAHDELLNLKAPYLNSTFFIIRYLVCLGLWIFFGMKMRANSLKQDTSGDAQHTVSNIKLSAIFLPLFAVSFTLVSIDLTMSLQPHWFSTMYGVYCFAGMFYSGISLLAVMLIYSKRQGALSDQLFNENHLHDLGKFMFAFTVFWAYIMFSQFMLIWYANLPEETTYYLLRLNPQWRYVAIFWLLVHFIIPFFVLLPRGVKRNQKILFRMGLFMLLTQWLDVYILVMPVFSNTGPVFGWIELGTFLGFLGIFIISVGRFLEKVPVVPVKDPRMMECLSHSQ